MKIYRKGDRVMYCYSGGAKSYEIAHFKDGKVIFDEDVIFGGLQIEIVEQVLRVCREIQKDQSLAAAAL